MENKTQHTPEPWRIGIPGTVVADSAEGITIKGATGPENVEYYGGNLICESVCNANAARIVACVNACKNVPNDWLQENGVAAMIEERDQLKRIATQDIDAMATMQSEREHLDKCISEQRGCIEALQARNENQRHMIEELREQRTKLLDAFDKLLANPDRIAVAATAYHIAQKFPVSLAVQEQVDWYAKIIDIIAKAKGETNNG